MYSYYKNTRLARKPWKNSKQTRFLYPFGTPTPIPKRVLTILVYLAFWSWPLLNTKKKTYSKSANNVIGIIWWILLVFIPKQDSNSFVFLRRLSFNNTSYFKLLLSKRLKYWRFKKLIRSFQLISSIWTYFKKWVP